MKTLLILGTSLFVMGLGILPSAQSYPYGSERLRRNYATDLNDNPTYRDSSGTRYKHQWNYDPNGIGSYKMRGSDGSTLRCRRGFSRDRCETTSY